MSRMKKTIQIIEKYDKLPNGEFKKSMRKEMDELKDLVNYDEYKIHKENLHETTTADEYNDTFKNNSEIIHNYLLNRGEE